ncbi:peptidoglycan-binding protein [Embleya sp. NBC_00896]|uniref:peptidoglycan-binding protein n=1 Tax=Embleya sp. NBC_00896 TaxID=2975961 RepID=UPI003864D644|nr:peptidoglycan-binding protein [Embleya sp. NBC_00896]
MRRRTAWITAGATTAVVAVGGGALALRGGDSAADAGKSGTPPAATAPITRTDLVKSKTVDGRLDYADRRVVKSAVEGTVTKAAEVGSVVKRGKRLYERDARPVLLLYGTTPMFRDIKVGTLGPDVLQLERNLRDLGYGRNLVIDTKYDDATKAAVQSWQKALGVPEPSGEVGKGDVVFQPEAVRVVSSEVSLADQVGPDKAVLTVASTTPVVRAQLDKGDDSLAKSGTKVEITLPDGSTVTGAVAGTVRAPATEGPGAAGGAGDGIQVEIALTGTVPDPGANAGTASVRFVSESRTGVLTVPVEAVVALREGGYGLQIVQGTTGRTVRVQTGMTADGRIEVTGDGLTEGMPVGVAKP